MKVPAPSLAPILRSDTQGRILALLVADPSRRWSLTELVKGVGSSMPTVQREVNRAELAGIVTTERVGPTRLVQADTQHPLYVPLSRIVLATYGPPVVIAREFGEIEGTRAVVLFGSWAARYLGEPGRGPNDIDVLVIGSPNRDAVDSAAERTEHELGFPIQATVRSRREWTSAREGFIQELKSRPLVVVLVDENDVQLVDELGRLESAAGAKP